jgi:hypothetical protein
MVDVGGYALYYECAGQGSSTVILESGGTGDSSDWAAVIDGLQGTTRVCAYDRASRIVLQYHPADRPGRSSRVSGGQSLARANELPERVVLSTHPPRAVVDNSELQPPTIGVASGPPLVRECALGPHLLCRWGRCGV